MRFCLSLLFAVALAAQGDLGATKAEARRLFLAGAMEASAQRWQQALAIDPNDAEVRLNYGIVLDAVGRYSEANRQLTAAARMRATVPVLNNLAINLVHLKRTEEAEKLLHQILQVEPSNSSALYNLGQIEMAAGRWQAAVRLLGIAHTLPGPADPGTVKSLAAAQRGWADQLLHENRITESIPHYQAALELNPDEPGIYLGAAIAMLRGNDASSALAVLEEASRRFPFEVRVPIATGYAYESQSEWAKAETCYQKALRIDPKSVFAKISLARTWRLEGRPEPAIALLRTVAEQNPDSAPACYELGSAIFSADPVSTEGAHWMQRAAELAPKSAEPQYALAKAAMTRGNLAEAERRANLAVMRDAGSSPAHYLLATIYRRRGKPEAAAREFSRYEQLRKQARSSGEDAQDGRGVKRATQSIDEFLP